MEAQLLNTQGKEVGTVSLNEKVFGRQVRADFLHEYVTVYENNQRQFDANTKTRDEVSGSGKKPWKQKHTGRARAGSIRSPLWRKGGVVFGPRSGKVRLELPRQKSKAALAQALAARHADGALVFVEAFEVKEPKTKAVAQALAALKCEGQKVVLVVDGVNEKLTLAARNLPNVALRLASDLNAYEVLRAGRVVLTKPALEKIAARWN